MSQKTIYAYEFDNYGNWIKRTSSDLVTKEGRPHFKANRTDYQIITYYTDSGYFQEGGERPGVKGQQ
jgi:hypothetical protein